MYLHKYEYLVIFTHNSQGGSAGVHHKVVVVVVHGVAVKERGNLAEVLLGGVHCSSDERQGRLDLVFSYLV